MKTGHTRYGRDILAVPASRKDGAPLSIEFTIQMIWDDEGKLLGASAIIRDVTERFTRDRGMRKRLAELEAKARAPDPEH
jgi:signal transduction histidine kinase